MEKLFIFTSLSLQLSLELRITYKYKEGQMHRLPFLPHEFEVLNATLEETESPQWNYINCGLHKF